MRNLANLITAMRAFRTPLILAYRLMYRQNRTVNVNWRAAKRLAGDEWVVDHLVRPDKMYAKAQMSISVLKMMSCSSNILEMNKKVYISKETFDINPTRKHHTSPIALRSVEYDTICIARRVLAAKG